MALLICPDCGNAVSDAAPACSKCGRPRVRDGGAESWKRKGGRWSEIGQILGGVMVIGLALLGGRACFSHNPQADQKQMVSKTDAIASGQIDVAAGKAVHYTLTVTPDMIEPVVKGTFSASGGNGNDIVAAIADEANYVNWVNGHKADVLWQTEGQQTVGEFQVKLSPGTYYLGISNRFSLVSDKQVSLDVSLNYQHEEQVQR